MCKVVETQQCSAINCKNYQSTRSDLAFHRFPKDAQRCARWVQNLRNASLHGIPLDQLHWTYRVCSAHFHSSQFKRPSDVHGGLNCDAVPTRIQAPNPPPPLDVERKRKPPKTRQELPRKKRKQSKVPPPSKDQHTGEAVAGPSSRAHYTEEPVAGPSSISYCSFLEIYTKLELASS
nr:52 kDa repressor of the inhibitor of the protein kinase-like [Misgurnus anguillicaudatus]XP_055037398.1 52 kDa repressor of the inhibitor of the protein kinase-like [Misgurnus anguillicaudatus]